MTVAQRRAPAPLEALLAEARAHFEQLPVRDPNAARSERLVEARAVLERVPGCFRRGNVAAWVRDPRISATVGRWGWGSPNMLVVGPTGIGKSSAAAALFRRLLSAGVSGGGDPWLAALRMRWFAADALGRARREHKLGRGDAPELDVAACASLLVIDDAGWDRDPEGVSGVLAARYERLLPTLITSGKTLDEMGQHYGAAVMRKLVEVGGKRATIIDCFAGGGR